MSAYAPPLDRFLTLGEVNYDYLANGITSTQVPELIRMATDDALNNAPGNKPEVWAPMHAWRALAWLRAEEAVGPLLSLLKRIDENHDDLLTTDLPIAFGNIGSAAVAPLADYLANREHLTYARAAAGDSLRAIGLRHPAERPACVKALAVILERPGENDPSLNGLVISSLADLAAVEYLPLVKAAYDADAVDLSIIGDFEEARPYFDPATRPDFTFARAPENYWLPRLEDDYFARPEASYKPRPVVDLRAINKAAKQARSKAKKAKKNQARKQ